MDAKKQFVGIVVVFNSFVNAVESLNLGMRAGL